MANFVRALSFVSVLLSLVASLAETILWSSGMPPPCYGFAAGLSDAERCFFADHIKQRLSVALQPLTSSSEGA